MTLQLKQTLAGTPGSPMSRMKDAAFTFHKPHIGGNCRQDDEV